jgi:hypothetical protein
MARLRWALKREVERMDEFLRWAIGIPMFLAPFVITALLAFAYGYHIGSKDRNRGIKL